MPHKDPEQARAYQLEYARVNADRKREAARQWRQENPERSRQARRDYVQSNRETVLEDGRQRYWADPDKANEGRRKRRQAPGGKTPRERLRDEIITVLWARQGGLRIKLAEMDGRLAGKPRQLELGEAASEETA